MLLDNKGRVFGKISIIDIFVVLILAFIVLFGILRFGTTGGIGIMDRPVPVTISFFVDEVENFTAQRVRMGDTVADNFTGVAFGNVENIRLIPRLEYNFNAQGMLVSSEKPGFSEIEITTTFYAHPFQNGIFANGHTFLVGEQMVAQVGDTSLWAMISDIIIHE